MTMQPSIHTFARALMAPDLSFGELADAEVVRGADGRPRLTRTSRFAEAEIRWRGGRWLLLMPLSRAAMLSAEHALGLVRRLCGARWVIPYRMLAGEMRWQDDGGAARSCDLLLQPLPGGRTFGEALAEAPHSRLAEELGILRREMAAAGVVHRNLREENLLHCAGGWALMRCYDLCEGGEDARAFEALAHRLDAAAERASQVCDAEASYDCMPALEGHLWTGNLFEGLVCVEDAAGYGYVDGHNRWVIPPQYLWAGDFREGRAEVETPQGMGLIDREGRYVIPPRYEIVDYDPAGSVVRVRRDGRWALFDYLGRQLTDFGGELPRTNETQTD